jgi:hypothetical protein
MRRNYPSAPIGFSYLCGEKITFRHENVSLIFDSIQAEPFLALDEEEIKFSTPYDCVGITTIPILAGIFVTSIFAVILAIGITAILDIKTPNKFETRGSKPLTFTVQE